jgi:ABC-2 type transport system ATP-binding protein
VPTLPRTLSDPAVPALSVEQLTVTYGPVTAVDGLNLTAPRGALTAVLGRNGAGKTTTIEAAEGYRRPDRGRVLVLGRDAVRERAELRTRVGVMLQEGGAYAGARVGDLLRATARLYQDPQPVEELLDRLDLRDLQRQPIKRLSGGQAQRVRLALAVVGRPEVAFLDEPSAGLDPHARHATWDLLRELRASGVSVILTTHYLEEAEQLADHVVILDAGRAIACGTTAELTQGASGSQIIRFTTADETDLAAVQTALSQALPGCTVLTSASGRIEVSGAVGPQTLAEVAAWCSSHGVTPHRLELTTRSLEDVFLDLTGRELGS